MLGRTKITAISMILLLLFLSACGSNNGNNGDNGNNGSAGKKVTITMEAGQAMKANYPHIFDQANLDEFEKLHNIKVEVIIDPDNQVKNILQTKIATNETPDLIVYNKVAAENELNAVTNMLNLSDQPWVSRLVDADSLKAPDGNIYGFVMQMPLDAQAVVYNKDIFEELGLSVPTSYDEFLEVCEALEAAGINPLFAPFKDAWTFQIWTAGSFGYYAEKVEPGLWDKINAGEVKWSEVEAFREILERGLNLAEQGYISKSALSDDFNMAPNAFSKREAAMMIMGDWFVNDMAVKDPELNLGLFPIPAFNDVDELNISQSQLGGMVFIPEASEHQEEAKKFLDFVSQKEQMDRAQAVAPFMPSVTDASEPQLTPLQQEIYDNYIETGRKVVEMNAFMKVDLTELWKYYQDMFAGGKTPQEVLEAWDKKFAELMKASGQPGF
ncbi:ABC transporter substrate-binding protein [Marinicrinis lubricantis]|uniref:ABC transporter substrate-binding protein n=1 Tax=Marinicrinis lubricantis TaxID=2086470 RepID=A0ABW1IW12_9BACL